MMDDDGDDNNDDRVQNLKNALNAGMESFGFPGIALSISCGADDDDWNVTTNSWAVGYSNLDNQTKMNAMTDCFCIGSITKTFVAVVIFQLVQEEKVNLERTAVDYICSAESKMSMDKDVPKLVKSIANTSAATIRQVLCHQSGIPTWEFEPDWIQAARGCKIEVDKVWNKEDTLKYLQNTKATGEPGECFSYSNTNYTLLGLVIESVTGNTATAEIRKRILDPLGMKSAYLESFETPTGKSSSTLTSHYHFATPEFRSSAGISETAFQSVPNRDDLVETTKANLSCEWTAGGMVMTMPDLATYASALFRQERLLSSQIMKTMLEYQPPKTNQIGQTSAGHKGKELGDERYSLGICHSQIVIPSNNSEEKNPRIVSSLGHGGLTLGFSSKVLWLKEYDIVIACATNVGLMHSGLEDENNDDDNKNPWDVFVTTRLVPAVLEYCQAGADKRQ